MRAGHTQSRARGATLGSEEARHDPRRLGVHDASLGPRRSDALRRGKSETERRRRSERWKRQHGTAQQAAREGARAVAARQMLRRTKERRGSSGASAGGPNPSFEPRVQTLPPRAQGSHGAEERREKGQRATGRCRLLGGSLGKVEQRGDRAVLQEI